MIVEGVRYHRYVITYRLLTGRRRRLVRWSPGEPWIRQEIGRELDERHGIENITPHSVRIK